MSLRNILSLCYIWTKSKFRKTYFQKLLIWNSISNALRAMCRLHSFGEFSNHKEIQHARALIAALPYIAASHTFKIKVLKDLFSKTSNSKGKFRHESRNLVLSHLENFQIIRKYSNQAPWSRRCLLSRLHKSSNPKFRMIYFKKSISKG